MRFFFAENGEQGRTLTIRAVNDNYTMTRKPTDNWLIIEGHLIDKPLFGIQRAGAWLLGTVYALFGLGVIVIGVIAVLGGIDEPLAIRLIGALICFALGALFVAVAIRMIRSLLRFSA